MKKYFAFLTFLLFTVTFGAAAQTPHIELVRSGSEPSYDALLTKLKSGDLGIDFKALRMKYTETKDYTPEGLSPEVRNRMYTAMNEKRYMEARALAEDVLKTNFVDISAHLVAGMANEALGDTAKFEFHKQVFSGLISSIMDDGDGQSRENSFTVISVPEEYAVLDYLRLARDKQFSASGDGHMYDVFSVTDKESGGTAKLYFNIDIIWKVRNKNLNN